ncbi:MAG: hypothetical protein KatS3mg002_1676 [Candidatus Woesearchaeota archaeon]|nr:MAG: hypothetical protein KatS3mg002_1676 [Candidatus Woesearchaeota archaeon]
MKKLTPIKAIRKHCLECSSGIPSEVKNCIITDCPLYPFRLGKNPNRKSIGDKNVAVRRINSKIVS